MEQTLGEVRLFLFIRRVAWADGSHFLPIPGSTPGPAVPFPSPYSRPVLPSGAAHTPQVDTSSL